MIRPPHRSPPTDTLFPYPTLFRAHPEPRRPFPWRAPFPAFSRAVSVLPCALQQPLARFVPLPAPSVPILRVPPCHLVFCRSSVLVREAPSCRYRSDEHTSELQSLMRISYAVFCLTKNKHTN